MSMLAGRGVVVIAVMLALATVVLAFGSPARGAQVETPAAEEGTLPDGLVVDSLQRARLTALPAAPAYIGLARLTYAPGTSVATPGAAGTTLLYVESGTLVVQIGAVEVVGPATPVGSPAASPVAGGGTPVEAGSAIAVPADTPFVTRNDGPGAVVALRVTVDTSAGTPPLGANLVFQRLANGVATTLPTAPAAVDLSRITLDAGASTAPVELPGPVLVFVEVGTLSLVTPGSEATLSVGNTAFIQGGTESSARNAGVGPLVLLILTVFPATEDGEATPAA